MPSLIGWSGRPWLQEVAKTTNYTVVLADSGTLFTTTGAGATMTFTLPSLATGVPFCAWFINTTSSTSMAITAPSGKLNCDGASNCTTATYSTMSHILGSCCMVLMNDLGTFYYLINLGNTTITTT